MSASLENPTGPEDQVVAGDYDGFAAAYAAETESNLINGYYTRPAILGLAGNVAGRRILDVGCGAGPLLEALRARGAAVTGAEPSAKMLELARRRLGEGADLHQAGLGDGPLPFSDGAFDDVIACLVLHYLEDWKAPLAEIRRVLAPGGRLIVAVNHPSSTRSSIPAAITSRPTSTSRNTPSAARASCCPTGTGRYTRWPASSPRPGSGLPSSANRRRRRRPANCSPRSS